MKKPFYKKWWFWVIVVVVVIGIGGAAGGGGDDAEEPTAQTEAETLAAEKAPNDLAVTYDSVCSQGNAIVGALQDCQDGETTIDQAIADIERYGSFCLASAQEIDGDSDGEKAIRALASKYYDLSKLITDYLQSGESGTLAEIEETSGVITQLKAEAERNL